jgi:hypothetical protein
MDYVANYKRAVLQGKRQWHPKADTNKVCLYCPSFSHSIACLTSRTKCTKRVITGAVLVAPVPVKVIVFLPITVQIE